MDAQHRHAHGPDLHVHGPALHVHGPALHVHGVVLPGREPTDLWISGGHLVDGPLPEADTIARNAWIVPGLVDAHCHVGLGAHGAVPVEETEQQALTERAAGTLLIRDAGSPQDTHWIDDREDLPRIIRAGRHIARPRRYLRNYAVEIDPAELVRTVAEQARRGDGWVKLVGDWIDREHGDLAPLWSAEVAAQAIAEAHRYGARVTAHCFAEESARELVEAGIDGIEHGTGLDDHTIDLMAERHVALVPTMVNLENFPQIAASGEAKFPRYAAHMRDLYERRFETLGSAREAGVPIYAGTDAGGTVPHGLIASEVELLGRLGGPEFALGAASWRARAWLGAPALEPGAAADLIVYDSDPLADPGVLRHPRAIILRGRVY